MNSYSIGAVHVHVISAPLPEPFAFSQGWAERRSSVLVEIETRGGAVGWGECLCHGLQSPQVAAAIVRDAYAPHLIGRDSRDIEVLWEELYNLTRPYGQGGAVVNALSGVDIALWDLLGRNLGQPISRILGGKFREDVVPYVTGFYRRREGQYPKDGIEEARAHVADGFRALKLKVGFGVSQDVAYIRAVREALGSEVVLMADANCAYSVPEARELLTAIAECRLHFFEELLAPENLEGYQLLRALGLCSIAAGENLLGKHAIVRWISGGALDYLQPDICSSGGFTELKKIAAVAQSFNTPIIPHVWGSGVCLAASLQFLAAIPSSPLRMCQGEALLEYDRSDHPFRAALIHDAIRRNKDGKVSVPDGPGLGVEINREVIKRYAV